MVELYAGELADWAAAQQVGLPVVPAHCEHPAHLFYLMMPTLEDRQAFIEHAKSHGVCSVFHYQPLHLSPQGRRWGGYEGQCPVSESISRTTSRPSSVCRCAASSSRSATRSV